MIYFFSILFSITINSNEQTIHVCVTTDDNIHYLILIYPPIQNLHVCLLEQQTRHLIHLIKFLFNSIHQAISSYSESIKYFFNIFFYRLYDLSLTNSSLIDELLPVQFNDYGTSPKLNLNDQQLLFNIDNLLNQLECQEFNQCSNEYDYVINRYRRIFFVHGCILFHHIYLLTSHVSNEITNDIYRFLNHYGHLNIKERNVDTCYLLLFKEIFPHDYASKQRLYVIVCSQGDLTLAVIIQNEYEKYEDSYNWMFGLVLGTRISRTPRRLKRWVFGQG